MKSTLTRFRTKLAWNETVSQTLNEQRDRRSLSSHTFVSFVTPSKQWYTASRNNCLRRGTRDKLEDILAWEIRLKTKSNQYRRYPHSFTAMFGAQTTEKNKATMQWFELSKIPHAVSREWQNSLELPRICVEMSDESCICKKKKLFAKEKEQELFH